MVITNKEETRKPTRIRRRSEPIASPGTADDAQASPNDNNIKENGGPPWSQTLHLAIGKQKQLIEPGQGRTPMGNDNRDAAPRAHRVDCLRQGGVARLTGVLFTQEHIFDASADAGCQWNCLSARW